MEPKTFQKYLENLNKVSSIMSYKNDEEKLLLTKKKQLSKLCKEVCMQK